MEAILPDNRIDGPTALAYALIVEALASSLRCEMIYRILKFWNIVNDSVQKKMAKSVAS